MPEGILESLRATEVRDQVAYLASPKQVPLPVRDMLPSLHLLEPFWNSDVDHGESVLFVQDAAGGPATGKLLFAPGRVLTVRSADGRQVYEAGKDYDLAADGRGLVRTAGSRILFVKSDDLFPPKGSPRSIAAKAGDPGRSVLFDNGHWFHDRQVEMTYTRKGAKWSGHVPSFAAKELPKTIAKLRAGRPLTMAVSGDSISFGYNASRLSKVEPFQPAYPELVAAQLEATHGSKVKLVNRTVSGWTADKGLADLDRLLDSKPDLVLIAYGMNDVSARNPSAFKATVSKMLTRIRSARPDAEVVLVAPMLGTADWSHTPREMFPKYQGALASLRKPGVALADLTTLWQEMLKRKRDVDLTGNGVNHPSDHGHRLYAQVILALLTDPERLKK
jgi:lysophospholipase L1-like esterase